MERLKTELGLRLNSIYKYEDAFLGGKTKSSPESVPNPIPLIGACIRIAIVKSQDAKHKGGKRALLVSPSGHDRFRLRICQAYRSGNLFDFDFPFNQKAILK